MLDSGDAQELQGIRTPDVSSGGDGVSRFFLHWAWTLAGQCPSEHPLRSRHWVVGLLAIQRS